MTPRAACIFLLPILALAACATPQQRVAEKEDHLAAAGFMVKPANTPEREAMLTGLPRHHFVQRVNGDEVIYVYADPLVCNCLYVGNQQAYGAYKQYIEAQKLATQQELTAEMYSNPNWSLGAWGPWGPGWRFGPGYGW